MKQTKSYSKKVRKSGNNRAKTRGRNIQYVPIKKEIEIHALNGTKSVIVKKSTRKIIHIL